jgi:hypothetical protein
MPLGTGPPNVSITAVAGQVHNYIVITALAVTADQHPKLMHDGKEKI